MTKGIKYGRAYSAFSEIWFGKFLGALSDVLQILLVFFFTTSDNR